MLISGVFVAYLSHIHCVGIIEVPGHAPDSGRTRAAPMVSGRLKATLGCQEIRIRPGLSTAGTYVRSCKLREQHKCQTSDQKESWYTQNAQIGRGFLVVSEPEASSRHKPGYGVVTFGGVGFIAGAVDNSCSVQTLS